MSFTDNEIKDDKVKTGMKKNVLTGENITKVKESGKSIKDAMLEWNWEYRKTVCQKCTDQVKLKCRKYDNFKDGIQETHCDQMTKARIKKFDKHVNLWLKSAEKIKNALMDEK